MRRAVRWRGREVGDPPSWVFAFILDFSDLAVSHVGLRWLVGVWIGVGCGVDFWWIPVGVCVVVGRGGLRGGSRWVCEVALGGGGGFWSIPVVMGGL
uniref:Uncharacterized protein n=1 Tax=Fagus sylvatica TaxID=28930 RepID=A0A2N9IPW6_FAGSY